MSAVRTIISCSLVLALAALPACQSCSDRRSGPAAGDSESENETHRLDTVRLKSPPGNLGAAIDLPAPRVRSLELLAAGKEPRQPLRYATEAGENALTVTVRVDSRELVGEEWTPWGTLPELRYGLALRRVAAGNALEVRGLDLTVGQPAAGSAPDVAAYVARATEEMSRRYRDQVQGRRASATIDARGRIEVLEPVAGSEPQPGAHTRQEMLQILAESVVPLPEEPVGVGARWQVTMLMRRGAGMVNQVATYELVAVDEKGGKGQGASPSWRIKATINQDGEHQAISPPELPNGVSAELLALLWRADGELEVSPQSLTPRSGKLAIEYSVHSRLASGGESMDLVLATKGTIELATAAAAP